MYTIYSILFIVFIILIIVTAFITIALTYFQLAVEDHRWWWRSIMCGGSTGACCLQAPGRRTPAFSALTALWRCPCAAPPFKQEEHTRLARCVSFSCLLKLMRFLMPCCT